MAYSLLALPWPTTPHEQNTHSLLVPKQGRLTTSGTPHSSEVRWPTPQHATLCPASPTAPGFWVLYPSAALTPYPTAHCLWPHVSPRAYAVASNRHRVDLPPWAETRTSTGQCATCSYAIATEVTLCACVCAAERYGMPALFATQLTSRGASQWAYTRITSRKQLERSYCTQASNDNRRS